MKRLTVLIGFLVACGGTVEPMPDTEAPDAAIQADVAAEAEAVADAGVDSCAWIFDPAIGCFNTCTHDIVDASAPGVCP